MAATFAVPGALLSERVGERVTGAIGSLLFALGGAWWVARIGARPDYAGSFLPGLVVGGAGVGLVIPSLTSAATSALPPHRFATGSAVLAMSRQIGVALGVAVLVALVGTSDAVGGFRDGYTFVGAAALAAVFAIVLIGPVRATSPAAVATEAA